MRPVFAFAMTLVVCLPTRAESVALLNLRIVQGEGVTYAAGGRATRGITVEITDELARPVPGVSISFLLPDSGPTGTFASGGRNEVVVTGPDGRASVWGMQWGRSTGRVYIRVTAALGGIRAGTVVTQTLVEREREASVSSGKTRRILLIAGIAVAAAGAGAAFGSRRSGETAGGVTPAAQPTIGGPTITIGRP